MEQVGVGPLHLPSSSPQNPEVWVQEKTPMTAEISSSGLPLPPRFRDDTGVAGHLLPPRELKKLIPRWLGEAPADPRVPRTTADPGDHVGLPKKIRGL